MINERGLSEEVADKVWGYVQMRGKFSSNDRRWSYLLSIAGDAKLIERLRQDSQLSSQKLAVEALQELEVLFRYLQLFNVTDKVTDRVLFIALN